MTPAEPNPIAPRTVGINPIPAAPAAEEPTAVAARAPVCVSVFFFFFCWTGRKRSLENLHKPRTIFEMFGGVGGGGGGV